MWYFPFQWGHSNHISFLTPPAFCAARADSQGPVFEQWFSSQAGVGDGGGGRPRSDCSATQAQCHSSDGVAGVSFSLQDVRKLKWFIGCRSNYHTPSAAPPTPTLFWAVRWIPNTLASVHTLQLMVNDVQGKCFHNWFLPSFHHAVSEASEFLFIPMKRCSASWVPGHFG